MYRVWLAAACIAVAVGKLGEGDGDDNKRITLGEEGGDENNWFFHQIDTDHNGVLDVAEFLSGVWKERDVKLEMFNAADQNKDGLLSGAELDNPESLNPDGTDRTFRDYGKRTESLSTLDENGIITLAEYKAAVVRVWSQSATTEFTAADVDKDDKLSAEEFETVHNRMLKDAKARLFQTYNDNKDSEMSKDEWYQMVWISRFLAIAERAGEFFDEADEDANNVLTLAEYMAHGDDSNKDRFDSWIPSTETKRDELPKEMLKMHVDHEFHTVAQGTFDKADKNKDGKLDMSEWDNAEEHGFHIEM